MGIDLILPKLGPEMESAVLVEWLVRDGDEVTEGQSVASVETAKATADIPAPAAGAISGLVAPDGEYAVGEVLAVIGREAAQSAPISTLSTRPPTPPTLPTPSAPQAPSTPADRRLASSGRIAASPLVRVLAREHGIDLAEISHRVQGRPVRRADVEEALRQRAQAAAAPRPNPEREPTTRAQMQTPVPASATLIDLTPMRRSIARHMQDSLRDTAQVTDVREHEVSRLMSFRDSGVLWSKALGFRPGYTDLLVRAAALALREVPVLNSTLVGDAQKIEHDEVNIGIAVAVPDGLVVPVVRAVDRLSLRELHERIAELVDRARRRRLSEADLAGGTFTVTNIGSYGSQIATPILVTGQVGILATGAFTPRPVVRDGDVVAGTVLHTSLTIDHRLVDGQAAGEFQTAIGRFIAEPERLL